VICALLVAYDKSDNNIPSTPCISYLVKIVMSIGTKGRNVLDTDNNEIFTRLFVSEMRKRLGGTSCVQHGSEIAIILFEFSD
jgi:hypothetical protein